jgi:hypothetical protein
MKLLYKTYGSLSSKILKSEKECVIYSTRTIGSVVKTVRCPSGPPVSSTNKTDIIEILLKVALNTIKQTSMYQKS